MIPSYRSSSSAKGGAITSLTPTAPTGIVEGDLLMAFLYKGHANAVTVPSGFTQLKALNSGGTRTYHAFYKLADSGDAAAGSFAFSWTTNTEALIAMIAISTPATTNYIGTENVSWIGSTTNLASVTTLSVGSITPDSENSLMVYAIGANTATTFSNYAMGTDNPTWVERIDTSQTNFSIAVATADRTFATATGNITADVASPPTTDYASAYAIFIKQDNVRNSLTLLGVS